MKLLFDANLSPRLAPRLCDLFPGSIHVLDAGMEGFTSDQTIWKYASEHEYVIVTADSDFLKLLQLRGAPPKVVRLEKCDYKTAIVEALLGRNAVRIYALEEMGHDYCIIRRNSSSTLAPNR